MVKTLPVSKVYDPRLFPEGWTIPPNRPAQSGICPSPFALQWLRPHARGVQTCSDTIPPSWYSSCWNQRRRDLLISPPPSALSTRPPHTSVVVQWSLSQRPGGLPDSVAAHVLPRTQQFFIGSALAFPLRGAASEISRPSRGGIERAIGSRNEVHSTKEACETTHRAPSGRLASVPDPLKRLPLLPSWYGTR